MTVPATGLFVAPCDRQAALWAVRAYHYSRKLPSGRCLYWGLWFDGAFVGVVLVSRGASPHIGSPFGLSQDRVAELTRVALKPGHAAPVSQVLAIVVRLLKKSNPGLHLLVSYADSRHGHDGRGVYGGAGWIYLGETHKEATLRLFGKEVHARTVSSKFGTRTVRWLQQHVDPHAERIVNPVKHKWAVGLTPTMRERLALMARPYPKREPSTGSGAFSARTGFDCSSSPSCVPAERGRRTSDRLAPLTVEALHG